MEATPELKSAGDTLRHGYTRAVASLLDLLVHCRAHVKALWTPQNGGFPFGFPLKTNQKGVPEGKERRKHLETASENEQKCVRRKMCALSLMELAFRSPMACWLTG